ncbi:hypothetical protein [Rhizobium leguminosarum]|uniref:hypothetical protein n=1 Tax=Rhizobium leguminosarum TaxID=384 RepID=UPI0014421D19|nr:hypothetical protein [Rhizobium leguminosarum]MBY5868527.1 hypothetical protein [Rhizobium leguminosarum]NKM07695.1 hypothetical protein [Rhizobium leguminosarum bv. viciae]
MYEKHSVGKNIRPFLETLYARYKDGAAIDAIVDGQNEIELYVDFSFYLATRDGERAAIDFCMRLHRYLLQYDLDRYVGNVLLAQATFFDRIGKAMSRDMYALEAAEAFVHFGQFPAAEKALAMVQA